MRNSLLAASFLVAAAIWFDRAVCAEVSVSPRQGVLLLANGELIEGTIMPAGDRYDVHLPDGEIRVKRSQVVLVARDAQQCYRHKRNSIRSGQAQDYVELAEWCLRHGLCDEAEKEIGAARRLDATHPRIPLAEARLRMAREKPIPSQAAHTVEPKPQGKPLDTVVRNLPPGSVETFTNAVQPLLLNYCARAGCHGPQSTAGMRLERIGPTRYSGRKSTQRNLSSVLAMIDRENPDQSKLLQAPLRPHGGSKLPIFTDRRQSQYRQLVQWVYQVAAAQSPATPTAPPTLEERTAPLSQRGPMSGEAQPRLEAALDSRGERDDGEQGAGERPLAGASNSLPGNTPIGSSGSVDRRGAGGPPAPDHHSAVPAGEASQSATGPPFVPKDPFDPEVFNRRFFDH
jgi:hypothetical protein